MSSRRSLSKIPLYFDEGGEVRSLHCLSVGVTTAPSGESQWLVQRVAPGIGPAGPSPIGVSAHLPNEIALKMGKGESILVLTPQGGNRYGYLINGPLTKRG